MLNCQINRFLLGSVLLFAWSCNAFNDLAEVSIEESQPTFAVPLLNTQISTDDLVSQIDHEDISLITSQDGTYLIRVQGPTFRYEKVDLFQPFQLGFPIPIQDTNYQFSFPVINGVQVNKAVLKGGNLFFTFSSDLTEDIDVTVFIPQLSNDNVPFQEHFSLEYNGNPNFFRSNPIPLQGMDLNISENYFEVKYFALRSDGQRIKLPLVLMEFDVLDFLYLEGNLSRTVLSTGRMAIGLEAIDSVLPGEVVFEDAQLHIDLANSFGLPVSIRFDELNVQTSIGLLPLVSELINQPVQMAYPGPNEIGEVKNQMITFHSGNSNILDLVNQRVIGLFYDIGIILNGENDTARSHFLTDSSFFQMGVYAEVPLHGQLRNMEINRIVEIDFSSLDSLAFLELKMVVENGIPLAFDPQLQFLNESNQIISSLKPDNNVVIKPMDDSGNSSELTTTILYFTGDGALLNKIAEARSMNASLTISTPNAGAGKARLTPGQIMNIKIGAKIVARN